MPQLLLKKDGAIATLTISHPEKVNAFTPEMWADLVAKLGELGADSETRVIVIQGEGEKAFCSGGDIGAFDNPANRGREPFLAPLSCPKPVIAKVHGICYGGGLLLTGCCDIAVAADNSTFRMPAARLGNAPSVGGVARLVTRMGAAHVADIFMTARKFDAQEAARIGLVNRVVPLAKLNEEVARTVSEIAANAPLSVMTAKRAILETSKPDSERDAAALKALVQKCFSSADFEEGRKAFREKRDPKFTGK